MNGASGIRQWDCRCAGWARARRSPGRLLREEDAPGSGRGMAGPPVRQPVLTAHAAPFRVNAVGVVFAVLQLPLKPKETELPGAIVLL